MEKKFKKYLSPSTHLWDMHTECSFCNSGFTDNSLETLQEDTYEW